MFGLQASDLNLVTAVLVAVALIAPKMKSQYKTKQRLKAARNSSEAA
ncbi:ABC transporter permease protein [Vibrio ishigakensis]|nr:ABC transporter permease protein [Vibrio ishigakensis]